MIRCNQCRQPIAPRSIRPGAVLCPRCRPSTFAVTIPRGTAAPTTREERARLQAQADADRAAAIDVELPREMTDEHVIEIAWKNGALQRTADRIQREHERDGRSVDDDTALDLAKAEVVAFGSTQGRPKGPPNLPHVYAAGAPVWQNTKLFLGPQPRGGRTRSGGASLSDRKVRLPHYGVSPEERALARAVAQRKARRAADAAIGGTDRQREANMLVRGEGLSKAEAGRRMGISAPAVAHLLAKYDKSTKSTT